MLVQALDDLTPIADITDWVDISASERDLNVGGWKAVLPDTAAARLLYEAQYPGLALHDPATGWWWAGFQTARAVTYEGRRKTFEFSGVDMQAELARRVYLPSMQVNEEAFANYEENTLPLITSIHNIAALTFGSQARDPIRKIRGLVQIQPTGDLGPVDPWVQERKQCLDLWRDQLTGTKWTVRLRYRPLDYGSYHQPALVFETLERPTSNMVATVDTGQIEKAEVSSRAALVTRAISVGAETPGGREFADRLTVEAGWETRYAEALTDRSSLDATQLASENDAWHRSQGQHRSAKLDDFEATGWGRDLDLGWYLRTELGSGPDAEVFEIPVVESTVEVGSDGVWRRKVSVGAEAREGVGKVFSQLETMVDRLKRLERR